MDFEQLEKDLASRLTGYFFDVAPLPDTQSGFSNIIKSEVYVMYDSSDFTEPENLANISQKETFKIGFEVRSRTRVGVTGVLNMIKIVKAKILGYKPKGCYPLELVTIVPLDKSSPNNWIYYVQFASKTQVVEMPDSEIEGPLLNLAEFNNKLACE
jgi:hypothetical protein